MPKLTLAVLSELTGADIRKVQAVSAPGKGLTDVADLGPCVELRKLELRENAITNIQNIVCAPAITMLNLAKNQIESLAGIEVLANLSVLNVSCNLITSIEPLAKCVGLKAAVLNNNQIRTATALNGMQDLNTVVLSNNQLEKLDLQRCPNLRKLNVSKNHLRKCPSIAGCYHLKELRVNGNKLQTLPDTLMSSAQLCTLELGQNLFMSVDALGVIRHFRYLKNLNIRGNKFELDSDARGKLLQWAPSLTTVDGEKIAGRHRSFLHPPPTSDKAQQQDRRKQPPTPHDESKPKAPRSRHAEGAISMEVDSPGSETAKHAAKGERAGSPSVAARRTKKKVAEPAAREASPSPTPEADAGRLKKKKRKRRVAPVAETPSADVVSDVGQPARTQPTPPAGKKLRHGDLGVTPSGVEAHVDRPHNPPVSEQPLAASGVVEIKALSKKKTATARQRFDPSSLAADTVAASSVLGVAGVGQWD